MNKYKKFTLFAGLASLALIIFNLFIMEAFTRKCLMNGSNMNDPIQLLENCKKNYRLDLDDISVVALGDSHANNSLANNPRTNDLVGADGFNFFNFSVPSESVPVQYFRLKWIVKNLKPELLLLQADQFQFVYWDNQFFEDNFLVNIKYVDERIAPSMGDYPLVNNFFVRKFHLVLYSLTYQFSKRVYREFFLRLANWGQLRKEIEEASSRNVLNIQPMRLSDIVRCQADILSQKNIQTIEGDRKRHEEWLSISQQRFAAPIFSEHAELKRAIHEGLLEYYEKIIRLAQQHGISVIIVKYPQSGEWVSSVNKEFDAEFNRRVSDLSAKHHVKILDYRNLYANNPEYFFNPDHLNVGGAIRFSKLIMKDIEPLLIKNGKSKFNDAPSDVLP